jgi:hypothetical protein
MICLVFAITDVDTRHGIGEPIGDQVCPPSAAAFEAHNPMETLTPAPDQVTLKCFPVGKTGERTKQARHASTTKENSVILAEWDDSFSVLEDNDENYNYDDRLSYEMPAPLSCKRGEHNSQLLKNVQEASRLASKAHGVEVCAMSLSRVSSCSKSASANMRRLETPFCRHGLSLKAQDAPTFTRLISLLRK